MNFAWLNKQGVRSDQGFEVQMVSRDCIEYRESDRVLTVEVEIGMSGESACLLVSPDCFARWDDTPKNATLDDREQARIERNFLDAMTFQDVKIVVEDPVPQGT